MPTFTAAQAKKLLAKRGITDPAILKKAIRDVSRGVRVSPDIGSRSAPIPRTQRVTPPPTGAGAGGFITRGPTVEGVPIIPQVPIDPSRVPAGTPINIGFGPAPGGFLRQAGVAAGRFALRLPGTRQLAEGIAGRATTLRPFFGRGPTLGQAAGFAGGVIAAETILGAGERLLDIAARPFGGAGDVTSPQRGLDIMHPSTGRSIQTLPGVGGMLPPGTTIVKVWNTGTAQFARLADGRIAVQKRDGTIKVYRPQKHIVIPRNPRVGTLIRADKRLNRLVVGLRKVVDRGRTRRK